MRGIAPTSTAQHSTASLAIKHHKGYIGVGSTAQPHSTTAQHRGNSEATAQHNNSNQRRTKEQRNERTTEQRNE